MYFSTELRASALAVVILSSLACSVVQAGPREDQERAQREYENRYRREQEAQAAAQARARLEAEAAAERALAAKKRQKELEDIKAAERAIAKDKAARDERDKQNKGAMKLDQAQREKLEKDRKKRDEEAAWRQAQTDLQLRVRREQHLATMRGHLAQAEAERSKAAASWASRPNSPEAQASKLRWDAHVSRLRGQVDAAQSKVNSK